ncbi:MAG: ATP-dependent zinc metalloprotease FtsH [Candidatus Kapabacteria bacterium]|jgi:cell division protease FtsH|nr:ATP-dependent zinc metalloprotease FtsH [Candidatus Kapabacteria bacterium]
MAESQNNGDNSNKNKKDPFDELRKLGDGKMPPANFMRNMMLWFVLAAGIFIVYVFMQGNQKQEWPVSYTEYQRFLQADLIKEAIVVKSQYNKYEFRGVLKQPVNIMAEGKERAITRFSSKLGVLNSETEQIWAEKGITWAYEEGDGAFWNFILPLLPWVLIIGLYIFFMRRMQGGGSKGIFSFGKSRAKLLNEGSLKVTFDDVAGADEAKYELQEVIEFLKEPAKFQRLGGRIPRGVLLLGPPGTGKTLLARAVAGEANVPFFSISGADFVEMFVGVGASRVRDLFEQSKKSAPCIVFIDEIDAVGRHRGAGLGGGHDEREQTLNQLLVEMDGFEQNSGVIIIAATNRPDVLDPALLRPGRFDRQVVVDRPDVRGREGVFKVHTNKIPLGSDVDIVVLAKGTPGLSGADIANIVNEAALLAARRNSDKVTMYDFENAKDKVLMGVERKSMVISDKEKEMTAYHEMGHALAGKYLLHSDAVHKVTIIPRGRALGLTWHLPNEEFHSKSKEYFDDQLVVLLAGRAAERLIFNVLSTGASNDLQRASQIARKMVCEWGMSEVIGPVTFNHDNDEVFLGRDFSKTRDHSEETAQIIDSEVRRILTKALERAEDILGENIDILHTTSKILLEREILDGEELDILIKGEELPPISRQAMLAIKSTNFDSNQNSSYTEKEHS